MFQMVKTKQKRNTLVREWGRRDCCYYTFGAPRLSRYWSFPFSFSFEEEEEEEKKRLFPLVNSTRERKKNLLLATREEPGLTRFSPVFLKGSNDTYQRGEKERKEKSSLVVFFYDYFSFGRRWQHLGFSYNSSSISQLSRQSVAVIVDANSWSISRGG